MKGRTADPLFHLVLKCANQKAYLFRPILLKVLIQSFQIDISNYLVQFFGPLTPFKPSGQRLMVFNYKMIRCKDAVLASLLSRGRHVLTVHAEILQTGI